MNAVWTMVVVSRVVRTPWVDLNAFAILAISYTGTKRTALVSQCFFLCLRHICCLVSLEIMWHPTFWNKSRGTKTGDTLNSVLFIFPFNSPSLGFLALVSKSKMLRCCWCCQDVGLFVPLPPCCSQRSSFFYLGVLLWFLSRGWGFTACKPPL